MIYSHEKSWGNVAVFELGKIEYVFNRSLLESGNPFGTVGISFLGGHATRITHTTWEFREARKAYDKMMEMTHEDLEEMEQESREHAALKESRE